MVSRDLVFVPLSDNRSTVWFGSKDWANSLLRLDIAVCRRSYRDREVLECRIAEVRYGIDVLKSHGFLWQSNILAVWLSRLLKRHRGLKKRVLYARPQSSDPLSSKRERELPFLQVLEEVLR